MPAVPAQEGSKEKQIQQTGALPESFDVWGLLGLETKEAAPWPLVQAQTSGGHPMLLLDC